MLNRSTVYIEYEEELQSFHGNSWTSFLELQWRDAEMLNDHGVLNSPDGVTPWALFLCASHLQHKQRKRLLHSSLDTHCASKLEDVSTNCKAIPTFAQRLTHASFVEPTEQHPSYNWMSYHVFMTCASADLHETWFIAKLIGQHTYRQERGEGRRISPPRSLLILTAADSFATSDRIIEWGVIWESPHLPSCSLHPADTHRRRRTHTDSRVWRIAAVWLWHSSICWWKRCTDLNSLSVAGFCILIPHKHKYSPLLLTCNAHPHSHTSAGPPRFILANRLGSTVTRFLRRAAALSEPCGGNERKSSLLNWFQSWDE